jgi:hypothetical protein
LDVAGSGNLRVCLCGEQKHGHKAENGCPAAKSSQVLETHVTH